MWFVFEAFVSLICSKNNIVDETKIVYVFFLIFLHRFCKYIISNIIGLFFWRGFAHVAHCFTYAFLVIPM